MEAQKVKKTKKKFVVKLWMLITAALMLIILIGVLVMAFIPFKALSADAFSDYLYVNVYDRNGGATPMLSVKNEKLVSESTSEDGKTYAALLKGGLNGTKHSLLRGAMEFDFTNKLRFITQEEKVDETQYEDDGTVKLDKEGLPVTKNVKTVKRVERDVKSENDLRGIMQDPGPGRFVLEFVFVEQVSYTAINVQLDKEVRAGTLTEKNRPAEFIKRKQAVQPSVIVRDDSTEAKDNKQRDKTVYFDRARIVINDSQNVIQKYALYLYDSDVIAEGEAVISPVWIHMNTTTLYAKLCELRQYARGSDDNGEYVEQEDDAEY